MFIFSGCGSALGLPGYHEVSLSLSRRREAGFLALMGSEGRLRRILHNLPLSHGKCFLTHLKVVFMY